ncbi:MAG: hypothetical protein SCM96_15535 [Acidobacteriota bacterium]|nr:hypothetical protein [Acidobacteriota bacterium]
MEPEDVVSAFLEQRERFEEDEPRRKEERLGKFILSGSQARDFLFHKPDYPKTEDKQMFRKTAIGEDRVDIQTWLERTPAYKVRYTLTRVDGEWKISELYFPCSRCDGKGKTRLKACSRCKGTGWESLTNLMDE